MLSRSKRGIFSKPYDLADRSLQKHSIARYHVCTDQEFFVTVNGVGVKDEKRYTLKLLLMKTVAANCANLQVV